MPVRMMIAAIAVSMVATPAMARDFLYPWKAGGTLQQVSDDQRICMASARGGEKRTNADEQARMNGLPAPAAPANSKAWLAPGLDGQTGFFNGYYDCLRNVGYSIRRWPSRDYSAVKKLPDGGMRIMQAMVATETPHAEVPPGTIK